MDLSHNIYVKIKSMHTKQQDKSFVFNQQMTSVHVFPNMSTS